MASYLYVIETNAQDGIEQIVKNSFVPRMGSTIGQFKVYNSWGHLFIPPSGPVAGPIGWILIMAVATTSSGMNKSNLDTLFESIMQEIKTTYPSNLVVAINFQVDVLPILS